MKAKSTVIFETIVAEFIARMYPIVKAANMSAGYLESEKLNPYIVKASLSRDSDGSVNMSYLFGIVSVHGKYKSGKLRISGGFSRHPVLRLDKIDISHIKYPDFIDIIEFEPRGKGNNLIAMLTNAGMKIDIVELEQVIRERPFISYAMLTQMDEFDGNFKRLSSEPWILVERGAPVDKYGVIYIG